MIAWMLKYPTRQIGPAYTRCCLSVRPARITFKHGRSPRTSVYRSSPDLRQRVRVIKRCQQAVHSAAAICRFDKVKLFVHHPSVVFRRQGKLCANRAGCWTSSVVSNAWCSATLPDMVLVCSGLSVVFIVSLLSHTCRPACPKPAGPSYK